MGKQRGYLQCRGRILYLQWEYSFIYNGNTVFYRGMLVFIYQSLEVPACKWLFSEALKEGRDVHSFNAFGRAFHILVA